VFFYGLMNMLRTYISSTRTPDNRAIFGIRPNQIKNIVKKYGRMINVDIHLSHTFRHSYAINMIRNGVDIRRVELLLGHAGIQTTTVCLQFKDADLREVYDKGEF
jgi:site-specific recombinase XerD